MGNLSNIFFTLPTGTDPVTLRILPPGKGKGLFHGFCQHRLCQTNHTCHRILVNGRWQGQCDYCALYQSLWPHQVQEAREVKPIERYFYNVIHRGGIFSKNQGPMVFSMGKMLHTVVMRAVAGDIDSPALGDVTAYKTGRDLLVVRKMQQAGGGMMYPSYDDSRFLQPSVAGSRHEWDFWIASLHDLSGMVRLEDQATVQKVIQQHTGVGAPRPKKKPIYRSLDADWQV